MTQEHKLEAMLAAVPHQKWHSKGCKFPWSEARKAHPCTCGYSECSPWCKRCELELIAARGKA